MLELLQVVPTDLGFNPWGMLGCALAYAAAIFTAVDGIADQLVRRAEQVDPRAVHALRLKAGAKYAASATTVATAAVVLGIDGNWVALSILSAVFVAVVIWVIFVYRQGARS